MSELAPDDGRFPLDPNGEPITWESLNLPKSLGTISDVGIRLSMILFGSAVSDLESEIARVLNQEDPTSAEAVVSHCQLVSERWRSRAWAGNFSVSDEAWDATMQVFERAISSLPDGDAKETVCRNALVMPTLRTVAQERTFL